MPSPLRDPLVAPLAAIATGILATRWFSFEPVELLIAIAALIPLSLLSLRIGARYLVLLCCVLSFLLAGALTALAGRPGSPPELDVESSKETVIVEGCVVEPSVSSDGREQFVLELEPGARARVNLYLKEGAAAPALRYGQRVEFPGRVRRTRNFGNPGSFDYVSFLARKKIFWTVSVSSTKVSLLPGTCGHRLQAWIFDLRGAALDRLDQFYAGRPYHAAMMKALLVGESSQLEKVWTEDFRTTGTFHALVISGSHVAVLSGFLLFLLRLCWVPRTIALSAAVLLAWLYALVAGWEAPVIRSAAGLTLFLAGGLFYRKRRTINLLAAVALAFVLLDPDQLLDASFQLSFLAVAFLGAIAAPLLESTLAPIDRSLSRIHERTPDPRLAPRLAQLRVEIRLIAEALSLVTRIPARHSLWLVVIPLRLFFAAAGLAVTSAVVQAGLALPMALYFHRFSITGLSANVLIIPLMAVLVPLGFVAVLTGWLPVARIAAALLDLSQQIVHAHVAWEPRWTIPDPPFWLAAATAGAFLAVALTLSLPRWRVAAAVTAVALLGILVWHPFAAAVEPGVLEVTAIDVGQGDSLFVAFPDRTLMLFDGGGIATFGRTRRPRLDIGVDVVAPYLWTRSIRRIDVVALSHAHQDHIGGLLSILDNFEVREIWTGATPESEAWTALKDRAKARGVRIVPLHQGDRRFAGGVSVEVLAPASDYEPGAVPRNNDSLALRLQLGSRSFLLAGDIERAVESRLAREQAVPHADVLKVAHHGSKTSTTEDFLDAVRPAFAVISAGHENSYGHPHPDVVRRLEVRRIETLRTDQFGQVSFRTDGYRLDVSTNLWDRTIVSRPPVFER